MPSSTACQIVREQRQPSSADSDRDRAGCGSTKGVSECSPSALERNVGICDCMIDIAAALFNVSGRELRQPGRTCTSVARVRQIAMYVTHVVMGLTMSEVGRGFGRDRTTVLHACHLIEDMRDDADFDALVLMTERVARAALRGMERT